MSGWYSVKRGTLEHEMFAPEGKWSKFEAWSWMVESAAYKPQVIDICGQPHTVPRGALCFSLRFMADKWKWSVKSVRTFLAKLEAHKTVKIEVVQVGSKRGTARTQVTLCNYDKYQSPGHSTGTARAQHGHKEEQGNNIPVGEADKSAPDLASQIFTEGRKILCGAGQSQASAGRLLGKWRKEAGDAALIEAIGRAQREQAIDPVSFITGCLRFSKKKSSIPQSGDQRVSTSGQRMEFEPGMGWVEVFS
ncbi:hypothetical protein J7354_01470 [Sulfitobacter sp. R18_2]|uniref:hypothetical protein n=1 Tax=Sulfitobacter sp. R18_2 TaxID=2821105 RepID=UPI001ADB9697|nr:hypothetical protein [Sulfitobacter sp. R18_2]MBO9437320.1 hypothetical protein [Sulfitobacter sp. R18_2]